MSFGKEDDEFLTIDLKTLLKHKSILKQYDYIANIVPILTNYELQAGFVFKLAMIPIAYDVSIGEHFEDFKPNEFSIVDHISVDPKTLHGTEQCAFKSTDHKRITNLITPM